MSQPKLHDVHQIDLLSTIKVDDKGWNIALFNGYFNRKLDVKHIQCAQCRSICCDAAELGCDHQLEEVFMYCQQCLTDLINANDQKCPINSHENPIATPNRSTQRFILDLKVVCPYSREYVQRCQQILSNQDSPKPVQSEHVVDTMAPEESQKEGNVATPAEPQPEQPQHVHPEMGPGALPQTECKWQGSFKELINSHLSTCAKQNDPSFEYRVEIKRLNQKLSWWQDEVKRYKQRTQALQKENEALKSELMEIRKLRQSSTEEEKLGSDLEPDQFAVNGQRWYRFLKAKHVAHFHVLGKHQIDRQEVDEYVWRIKVGKDFVGRIGLIDNTRGAANRLKHDSVPDMQNGTVSMVGSANGKLKAVSWISKGWKNEVRSFICNKDVLTIRLNCVDNEVSFQSKTSQLLHKERVRQNMMKWRLYVWFDTYCGDCLIEIL